MRKEYDLKKLKRRPGPVEVNPDPGKSLVSIRLDLNDLALIRTEAARLGMPYQTLIGSIIHRFATGELVDKKLITDLKNLNQTK